MAVAAHVGAPGANLASNALACAQRLDRAVAFLEAHVTTADSRRVLEHDHALGLGW